MKVADISRAFLEYRDFNLERPATDVKTANFLRKIEDALKSHQGDEAATGTVLLELGKRAANRTKCVLLDKTRIDNSNLGDDEDKKLVAKSRTEILDDKVMAPTENCRLNDLDDRIVILYVQELKPIVKTELSSLLASLLRVKFECECTQNCWNQTERRCVVNNKVRQVMQFICENKNHMTT